MIKTLRRLIPITAFVLLPFSGWCANNGPGGSGILKNNFMTANCFKPNSGVVTEVCADLTINWKMWSLMGEPVGDYNVSWELTSISLMDQKRKLVSRFTPKNLPRELKKSAGAIELYIDGYASVSLGSNWYGQHRFNTGTTVRAGAGSSVNTPGSPNWDKLFVLDVNYNCDDEQATFMDAQKAKTIFKNGIELRDLVLCKSASVSELTRLESAIDELCAKKGADKQYQFCPEQKEEPKKETASTQNKDTSGEKAKSKRQAPSAGLGASVLDGDDSTRQGGVNIDSVLDESTERPLIQKRWAQETASYRRKAEPACRATMQGIDDCYEKSGCTPTAGSPSIEQCRNIPPHPYVFTLFLSGEGSTESSRDAYREELAERQAEQSRHWKSRYGSLSEECKQRDKERNEFVSCRKQYDSTCNPKKFTSMDDCLDAKVNSQGPTEQDARAQLKKEWNAKARTGKNAPQPVTNFLD